MRGQFALIAPWTLVFRCRPGSRMCSRRMLLGYPKFQGIPSVPLPCSQTPVGLSLQAIAECRCCPRLSDDEGSNGYHCIEAQSHGFGPCSIRLPSCARPAGSLRLAVSAALRLVPPSRVTTQCSLPTGGQPLPGGSVYPLGSDNMFQSISISMFYIFVLMFLVYLGATDILTSTGKS